MEVWSIINATPDSFLAESRKQGVDAVKAAVDHLQQGVDVVDIGAESSRPFSTPLPPDEEWNRLQPILVDLKKEVGDAAFNHRVSVDTWKPEIARRAMDLGVSIINDIRGGGEKGMFETVQEYDATIVLMHSQGTPETMQVNPVYNDVVDEVYTFLKYRSNEAETTGIDKKKIIWDFGIGFGKTPEHNLDLLKNLNIFLASGHRLMAGVSRKSFIGKLLNLPEPEQRKDPSLVLHTYLALHRVSILRVHDIKETLMMRALLKSLSPLSETNGLDIK